MLAVATAAAGLGFERDGQTARVVAGVEGLDRLAAELDERASPLAAHLRTALRPTDAWALRTRTLSLREPVIMGILNLTDDSFSGDGVGRDVGAALEAASRLREAGADILDVGAESARADRPVVDAGEEAQVVGEAVTQLVREGHLVSADTYKPEVAESALAAGAEIVNDISGLTAGMGAAEAAATAGAGYVLNYSYSMPKHRPEAPPVYGDVVAETLAWMFERLSGLTEAGLDPARVVIDPGIAFGKSHDEDLEVLRRVGEFLSAGRPVLLAHSRKNFIGSVSGLPPGDRDLETHIATAFAFAQGMRIFRVHDVAGTRRALDVAAALSTASRGDYAPDAKSWPWRAGASASHMTQREASSPPPAGQRW